jgi:hypothetical protein
LPSRLTLIRRGARGGPGGGLLGSASEHRQASLWSYVMKLLAILLIAACIGTVAVKQVVDWMNAATDIFANATELAAGSRQ